MSGNILEKLFEHNHWANQQILEACSTLTDEQLDAEPRSASYGSIRQTLVHLVSSQQGYLRLLTVPVEERRLHPIHLEFNELHESIQLSGEGLLILVRNWSRESPKAQLETTNGFHVEPWVVMVQIINHATEHREQVKSLLTAMEITPPELDGWTYGEFTQALIPKTIN